MFRGRTKKVILVSEVDNCSDPQSVHSFLEETETFQYQLLIGVINPFKPNTCLSSNNLWNCSCKRIDRKGFEKGL